MQVQEIEAITDQHIPTEETEMNLAALELNLKD